MAGAGGELLTQDNLDGEGGCLPPSPHYNRKPGSACALSVTLKGDSRISITLRAPVMHRAGGLTPGSYVRHFLS